MKSTCLYVPKEGKHIYITFNNVSAKLFEDKNKNVILLNFVANIQRSIAYADDFGSKTYSGGQKETTDNTIIDNLMKNYLNEYFNEDNSDIDFSKIPDEQCFSVISDRTKLEDSISNMIAYFLNRDKKLAINFVNNVLNIKTDIDETFEIIREQNNIDLLIKSNKRVIVIENKIDSDITIGKNQKNGESQLSKYFDYISNNKEFKNIEQNNKRFFLLRPDYHQINNGDKLKNWKDYNSPALLYSNLFMFFKNHEYLPEGKKGSNRSNFLYNEFIRTLDYIKSSKSQQQKETAFIRFKERLMEIEEAKTMLK